jgi:hypothetical protein
MPQITLVILFTLLMAIEARTQSPLIISGHFPLVSPTIHTGNVLVVGPGHLDVQAASTINGNVTVANGGLLTVGSSLTIKGALDIQAGGTVRVSGRSATIPPTPNQLIMRGDVHVYQSGLLGVHLGAEIFMDCGFDREHEIFVQGRLECYGTAPPTQAQVDMAILSHITGSVLGPTKITVTGSFDLWWAKTSRHYGIYAEVGGVVNMVSTQRGEVCGELCLNGGNGLLKDTTYPVATYIDSRSGGTLDYTLSSGTINPNGTDYDRMYFRQNTPLNQWSGLGLWNASVPWWIVLMTSMDPSNPPTTLRLTNSPNVSMAFDGCIKNIGPNPTHTITSLPSKVRGSSFENQFRVNSEPPPPSGADWTVGNVTGTRTDSVFSWDHYSFYLRPGSDVSYVGPSSTHIAEIFLFGAPANPSQLRIYGMGPGYPIWVQATSIEMQEHTSLLMNNCRIGAPEVSYGATSNNVTTRNWFGSIRGGTLTCDWNVFFDVIIDSRRDDRRIAFPTNITNCTSHSSSHGLTVRL